MTVQKHAPVVCLQTQALCLDLGKRTLLDALDWQVQAGQVWAVLGISGSGKSTLLRVLAGLPVPGQFSVRGQVSWGPQGGSTPSRKERARLLAWMSQSDFQPFACTVAQRVLAGRYPHGGLLGWETSADHASMNEALKAVGLEGFEQRQFQSLSGGEQRRASLAAALVQEPKLLLLDEPLSQLDWHHQTRLAGLFKPWALRNDAAVVWVTHDPNLALRYATHCLAFLPGGCFRQGPVQDFQNARLLGEVYGCAVEAACPMRCFFPVS